MHDETHDNCSGDNALVVQHIRACASGRRFGGCRFRRRRLIHERQQHWNHDGWHYRPGNRQQLRRTCHHHCAQQHHEPVGEHARSQCFTERLDTRPVRSGFRPQPVDRNNISSKPRISRGFFFSSQAYSMSVPRRAWLAARGGGIGAITPAPVNPALTQLPNVTCTPAR